MCNIAMVWIVINNEELTMGVKKLAHQIANIGLIL